MQAGISASEASAASHEEVRESDERKIRTVEARLADYKRVVQDEINKAKCDYGIFIIDDFYLINPAYQPEVIDYPHRLLRDTDLYLKVGTVRHRTRLFRPAPLRLVFKRTMTLTRSASIRRSKTLIRPADISRRCCVSSGRKSGLTMCRRSSAVRGGKDLVLLSGGVPRDYLNIFVGGLERARRLRTRQRVTPTDLRQSAAALSQNTKFRDLPSDAGAEVPASTARSRPTTRPCSTPT